MNDLITMQDGAWLLSSYAAEQIAAIETTIKKAKEQEDAMKTAILAAMEEHGIIKLDTDAVTITYVAPTTRETLDGKALRADFPEVYDAYAKLSPVKASVRIKVK